MPSTTTMCTSCCTSKNTAETGTGSQCTISHVYYQRRTRRDIHKITIPLHTITPQCSPSSSSSSSSLPHTPLHALCTRRQCVWSCVHSSLSFLQRRRTTGEGERKGGEESPWVYIPRDLFFFSLFSLLPCVSPSFKLESVKGGPRRPSSRRPFFSLLFQATSKQGSRNRQEGSLALQSPPSLPPSFPLPQWRALSPASRMSVALFICSSFVSTSTIHTDHFISNTTGRDRLLQLQARLRILALQLS